MNSLHPTQDLFRAGLRARAANAHHLELLLPPQCLSMSTFIPLARLGRMILNACTMICR